MEYYNHEKERRHNLSPIAHGTYKVVYINTDTVVLYIDGHHERILRIPVYRAPNNTLEYISISFIGQNASATSEPTDTMRPTPLRSSVLRHLHRGLSDLFKSEKTPSIFLPLSRVTDSNFLRVPTPPTVRSTGPVSWST